MAKIEVDLPFVDELLTWPSICRAVVTPVVLGFLAAILFRYTLTESIATGLSPVLCWAWAAGLVVAGSMPIYRHVYRIRIASKAHFLESYLRDDSPLRRYLTGQIVARFVSSLIAAALACIAYVVVQTYSWIDIAAIAVAMTLAMLIRLFVAYVIEDNIKSHVSNLFQLRLVSGLATFCVLLGLISAALIQDGATDWSKLSAAQAKEFIEQEVRHPLPAVEKPARLLRWLDVSVLRARDTLRFPFGWAIYLCLLMPNTLPAYSFAAMTLGFSSVKIDSGAPACKRKGS